MSEYPWDADTIIEVFDEILGEEKEEMSAEEVARTLHARRDEVSQRLRDEAPEGSLTSHTEKAAAGESIDLAKAMYSTAVLEEDLPQIDATVAEVVDAVFGKDDFVPETRARFRPALSHFYSE